MNAQKINEKYILNYWNFSANESNQPIETYRPRDFDFEPPLSPLSVNAGIEFYKNNTVKKFRVKLCGNDYEPNFKEGKWKIFQDKNVKKLKINFPKDEQLFEIIEISEDKLILKRL